MRPLRVLTAMVVAFTLAPPALAGWREDLAEVLDMEPGEERDGRIERIARAEPDWEDVAAAIEALEYPAVDTEDFVLAAAMCIDGAERPYVIYVPKGYDPAVPAPLLVRIHGGVGRGDIFPEPLKFAGEDEFIPVAEEKGWVVLYPLGQMGATWWDDVGMANMRNLIRTVKRGYNIDDDRVWLEGFSDGASGGFTHAMVSPDDYAAIVALNGHMGVGSINGGLHLYAPNLSNTPIYAVTTKEDELYPSEKMRPTFEMAVKAGADIIYRELEGGHDFEYAATEMPRIVRFLERNGRDPFPPRIVWEAGEARFGRCRWFKIDAVTTAEPEKWHKEYNTALVDERITVGFVPDYEFEGEGVRVSSVLEETAAEAMGLEAGDIIIGSPGMPIKDLDGLVAYKAKLERGSPIELRVVRGDGERTLRGSLPDKANYLVFRREIPSGLARAGYYANRIWVKTSRVGAFSVFIHPDMVNLNDPVTVTWNGKVVFDRAVEPDIAFMVRNFLDNRDRRLLYVARLEIGTGDK